MASREQSKQGSEGQNQTQCHIENHLHQRQRLTGKQLESALFRSCTGAAGVIGHQVPLPSVNTGRAVEGRSASRIWPILYFYSPVRNLSPQNQTEGGENP